MTSGYLVHKIDVEDTANICSVADIKLTTAAAAELEKIPKQLHDGVKKNFCKMLQELIKKVQERSPVGYKLVRVSACLNSVKLVKLNLEVSQRMFESLVGIKFHNKRISSVDADKAKEQFDKLLSTDVKINKTDFQSFDFKTTRLDEFFQLYVDGGKKYPEMCKVCIFVFTLSH